MREYHAHETARMQELDGIALADFWPRAAAFIADVVFALASVMVVVMIWGLSKWLIETGGDTSRHRVYNFNLHDEPTRIVFELVVPVLYFGLSGYFWNGRSPGKRIFGIRVVSLVVSASPCGNRSNAHSATARPRSSSDSVSPSSSFTPSAAPRRTASRKRSWSRKRPGASEILPRRQPAPLPPSSAEIHPVIHPEMTPPFVIY
jgi:hypothetical protein